MSIEENVFTKYIPDFDKLSAYGFKRSGKKYAYEEYFMDNQFKSVVEVSSDGLISGKVIDTESGEEYVPLKLNSQEGSYVGEVRTEYENILIKIRDCCFMKQYFVLPQSNRITRLIADKYGDMPEFLWEKYDDSGIFRNPASNKWYAAILDVDRSRLLPDKKGFTEVINLKLEVEHVQQIIKEPNFYPAYHMNKKYWISIILDDSVADNVIMKLVEESHGLCGKSRKK